MKQITQLQKAALRFSTLALVLPLLSCYSHGDTKKFVQDPIDPHLQMTRQDYKDALIPMPNRDKRRMDHTKQGAPIPKLAAMTDSIARPHLQEDNRLVSLSVTEDVPLKDVLIELGRLAKVDMEIDPNISGGVIFRVENKPFSQVIERLSKLASLRATMEDGIMRIERDLPYVKNYQLDFLNLIRSHESSVDINTRVLSSGGGASGGDSGSTSGDSGSTSSSGGTAGGQGLNSGSSNTLTSSYEGDVWASVSNGIREILNIESLQQDIKAMAAAGKPFVSLNRHAGIITVRTTHAKHNEIDNYIKRVRRSASAQVLIEAKIIEVTLNEANRAGINWSLIDGNVPVSSTANFSDAFSSATTSMLNLALLDKQRSTNLKAAIDLVEAFGTSRTLSSPRLHATNNQQSVLTFAENQVYFTLDIEREEQDGTSNTPSSTILSFDSELHTVPIGVVLALQPSINLDTNEITMNIRPTLSRITSNVADPAVTLVAAQEGLTGVTSEIPVVEVRELDSVLKIQSGQVMVIGGLMEERTINNDSGIPLVSRIPWVGRLAKSTEKTTEVIETVIFIRATIVPPHGVSIEDKQFYNTFSTERRSFIN